MLKLVAPASMNAYQQALWLASAVESLEGIRAAEVSAVAMEIKRSISHHQKIVPEIAKLVDEKRKRANRSSAPLRPHAGIEMAIDNEARERRAKAHSAVQIEEADEWERQARLNAGFAVRPREPALDRQEINNLSPAMLKLGLNSGFLKRDGDRIVEVGSADETDLIREEMRRLSPGSKPNGRDPQGLDAQHESRNSA